MKYQQLAFVIQPNSWHVWNSFQSDYKLPEVWTKIKYYEPQPFLRR